MALKGELVPSCHELRRYHPQVCSSALAGQRNGGGIRENSDNELALHPKPQRRWSWTRYPRGRQQRGYTRSPSYLICCRVSWLVKQESIYEVRIMRAGGKPATCGKAFQYYTSEIRDKVDVVIDEINTVPRVASETLSPPLAPT